MNGLCIVERTGSAAILRMNRPEKLNALSSELLDCLTERFLLLDKDAGVRGVVLTGSGRAFSAGADLTEALTATTIPDSLRYVADLRRITSVIDNLTKPVVAAIDGYCMTGGLEVALACDRRIASPRATFAVTSSRIGSVAGLGGTQRLPRLIGPSAAKDLLMTGRTFGAKEAYGLGVVDALADPDPIAAAAEWIGQVAQAAPLAVALAKVAVNVGAEIPLDSALQLERLLTSLAFATADRAEGMTATLEKRPARFSGK